MSKPPKNIKNIEDRIVEISSKNSVSTNISSANFTAGKKGLTIVIEFVSGVLVGCAFGYFLDYIFDTHPIMMILFLFFGAAAGFLNIYRFVKSEENKEKNSG